MDGTIEGHDGGSGDTEGNLMRPDMGERTPELRVQGGRTWKAKGGAAPSPGV